MKLTEEDKTILISFIDNEMVKFESVLKRTKRDHWKNNIDKLQKLKEKILNQNKN